MKRWMGLCVLVLVLIGCSDPRNDIEVTPVEDETTYQAAEEFVSAYKSDMTQAVGQGGFDSLEDYLIPNNSYYHSLRRYMDDLEQGKATKELLEFEVLNVYVGEDPESEFYVEALEEVAITYLNDDVDEISRHVEFELVKSPDGRFRIVTIRELNK
ncbi:TcaA NTF2-like domain-containing protein [Alkalihalobacillus pseudalcaliphilus]|uniref:TcaA NTF2-like domain-containing protein n=1 Tax=Alkalihalobacillus pseudalcaliphilus TaxID=79884 RepID=UPI00064DA8A2|nr:hypothetical protein [Alkalihalobacillus pseudalcaliphilus]KMK77088.1 hypothetical protein AB990_05925 [Alkalihalobacillus pseudalcaliphilus]